MAYLPGTTDILFKARSTLKARIGLKSIDDWLNSAASMIITTYLK